MVHHQQLPTNPPPTKQNIKAWWNQFAFVHKTKKETAAYHQPHDPADHPVFGKPLKESLRYASVQISTANAGGDLYVWGYIPVVVAKCGLYLKENATEVPGTFRVNGSSRRMRDLQAEFERPPRYGKSLDWKQESYTTHDVASVFRRYLTQMPEPVIPHDMYHLFRDTLAKQPFNHDEVIATYKSLIRRLPKANQYLLLYVLDLLSVFARKSDKNLMTATNLAVIFRPGLISHPQHEMSPQEHALSQSVLEFLIAQQDWFMLDIAPPPGGSPAASWDHGIGDNSGFEGKWKEDTVGRHSREGSRVGTPNAEAGPSMQRVQLGPSKHPQPQAHVHGPSPRQAYNPQLQQSQTQSIPQPQPQPLLQPQPQQPQPVPQQPQQAEHQHPTSPIFSEYGSEVDDVMIIPNSDEEYDGGWKLVSPMQGGTSSVGSGFMALGGGRGKGEGLKVVFRGDNDVEKGREKEKGIKTMRRRTALDRSEPPPDLTSSPVIISPVMLDTTQSPPTPIASATVGVTRSRTLPSRKKGGGDDSGTESGIRREKVVEKRVLKKQRRVSGGGMTSTAMATFSPTPNMNTSTSMNTNVVNRTSGG